MDDVRNGHFKATQPDLVGHIKDDSIQHVKLSVQYKHHCFKNKTLIYEFTNFLELQQFMHTINFNLMGFDDSRP